MPEIRPLSPLPATGNFFSVNCSANICSPFKRRLRAHFGFRSKAQHSSPPLLSDVQRKAPPNTPPEDLFSARKSRRFYVPKMSLKNANSCSVCAWLLTSGGLRLTLRLRRNVSLALRHQPKPLKGPPRLSFRLRLRAGADQAHTLSLTNRPLNRLLSLCKIMNAGNTFARRKARRGAEPSPLTRSGSATAFPRRVRVYMLSHCFTIHPLSHPLTL